MPETIVTPKHGNFQDLTGNRFGQLLVVSFAGIHGKVTKWNVRCDCGKDFIVHAGNLKRGQSTSCGCSRSISRAGRFDYASIRPAKNRTPRTGRIADGEKNENVMQYIRDTLSYCPDGGSISCKKNGKSRLLKSSNGYYRISVTLNKTPYQMRAHRVAWFLHHGRWPEYQIDHINGNRNDNRIVNLRECSGQSLNIANTTHHIDSTTKIKGVFRVGNKDRFRAQIMVDYRSIHLGTFLNKEDAARAYNAAAVHYFGEFARLNPIEESK
jgi:hypothetical protein